MFKYHFKNKLSTTLKGWVQAGIPFENRLGDKKWSDFFGHYQNQKWGMWDSNSCWCLGGAINPIETQLEMLNYYKSFSREALNFFYDNGYIDLDGDFSLSERFIEILGGTLDTGGTAEQAAQLIEKYGCIPRDMLTYTEEKANSFYNKSEFNADYFNKNVITPEMLALGKQFLKYVGVNYQYIGKTWTTPDLQWMRTALLQAPLSIGVPVPNQTGYWNAEIVQWDGTKRADHCIELYDIDAKGNYKIFDQYLPNLKTLAKGYFIPMVRQIVVTAIPQAIPIPVKQDTFWTKIWTAVFAYFQVRPYGSLR